MPRTIVATALLAICLAAAVPATAEAESKMQQLVDQARWTAERMLSDPGIPALRRWMRRARAVLIVPSLLKGGFLIGAESGSGVLLARDSKGNWSYPAFFTISSGSFGLQAGVQDSEVMFVIRTQRGLDALLKSRFKLGADASIAAGPLGGGGLEGATTAGRAADIYSYSRNRGVFGGVSFEGTVTTDEPEWNRAYYGRNASTQDIVIRRKVSNRGADALRRALNVR